MKTFEMSKKGVATVTFIAEDYVLSGIPGVKYSIMVGGVTFPVHGELEMKSMYRQYKAAGYVLKDVSAPKPQKQPENRILWCKEGKKAWAVEYNRRIQAGLPAIRSLKGKEYHEARVELDKKVKAEMKIWEAENAAQINQEILNRRAEAAAVQG